MKNNKKKVNKRNRWLAVLGLFLVSLFLTLFVTFVQKHNLLALNLGLNDKDADVSVSRGANINTSKYSVWNIKITKEVKPENQFSFDVFDMQLGEGGEDLHNTIHFKNYIIQNNFETKFVGGYGALAKNVAHTVDAISVFNIDTEEIFSIPLHMEGYDTDNGRGFKMRQVGNRLYFGFITSPEKLMTHYMNLPLTPQSKPKSLKNSPGADIVKIKGFYIGQRCPVNCFYSVVDPNSGDVVYLNRVSSAMQGKSEEDYIGFSSKGGEIYAVKNKEGEIVKLIAVPHLSEEKTIVLVGENQMPKGVSHVTMHPFDDYVVLGGQKAYIYNIRKGALSEALPLSKEVSGLNVVFSGDYACFYDVTDKQNFITSVNVKTKDIFSDTSFRCSLKQVDDDEIASQLFSSLKLPTKFGVVKENRIVKS